MVRADSAAVGTSAVVTRARLASRFPGVPFDPVSTAFPLPFAFPIILWSSVSSSLPSVSVSLPGGEGRLLRPAVRLTERRPYVCRGGAREPGVLGSWGDENILSMTSRVQHARVVGFSVGCRMDGTKRDR